MTQKSRTEIFTHEAIELAEKLFEESRKKKKRKTLTLPKNRTKKTKAK